MASVKFAICAFSAILVVTGAGEAGERIRIVNEGGIRDEWRLADGAKLVAPGYPAEFLESGSSVCVAMGYAIRPDGTTGNFGLLNMWNASGGEKAPSEAYANAFAQASAHALSQWKFAPREGVSPRETYTVATVTFRGKDNMDPQLLRNKCAIGDLAAYLQSQKANAFMRGHDRQDLENLRRTMDQSRKANAARAAIGSNAE